MTEQVLQDKGGITGLLTFTNFVIDCPRAEEINRILEKPVSPERYEQLTRELGQLCQRRVLQKRNLVVLAGRSVVAGIIIGETTYTGAINYGALGTSATAVNAADTQLGAEVARKLFARRSRSTSVCSLDFFYSKADTNGTYEEFGTVIDGTASANTGQLFNHLLTGGWTKTNNQAMTVSLTININP